MSDLIRINDWYKELIIDLRKLEFTGIVLTKWNIGKRIDLDIEKFGKPEYGSKRIENLAKDLNGSADDLWACHRFFKKYDTKEKLDTVQQLSWRYIWHKLLPKPKTEKPEIPHLPEGKYNIIYVDPPWQYYEGGYKNQSQYYDTMTIEEICALPISELAADNCILFLWITSPVLPDAIKVMESWGFKYSTVGFVWIKSLKDGTGFAFGCGNWTRANAEYCLIGLKGNIERKDATISQIIYLPKERHSKKPDIVRKKILQLVGDLPRIELFGREKIEGWEVWGKEV